MPLVVSGALDTVLAAVDYRLGRNLTVNLPAGPYVDFTRPLTSMNLTAAMTSPLPEDARTQGGIEEVTADFVLTGTVTSGTDTIGVCDLFNPDNLDSPLAHLDIRGCSVFWEIGAMVPGSTTPETPRVLTAWITDVKIDWNAQTVTLHVIDLDPDWDDTPSIPAVVTAAPFNAGLTNEYPMDALIRRMKGASTWPATRPDAVLAIGFRTSLWADVGTLTSCASPPVFGPGADGSALIFADTNDYAPSSPLGQHVCWEQKQSYSASYVILVDSAHSAHDYRAFLAGPSDPDGHAEGIYVQIGGGVFAGDTYYVSQTITDGPHYLGVHVNQAIGSASYTVTVRYDHTTYTSGTLTASSTRPGTIDAASLDSVHSVNGTLEAHQSWSDATPTWNDDFVPIAILDPSKNSLTVVPAIAAGTKSWDEMQTMASSECGFVRRDGNGVIRFTNRDNLLGQAPSDPITSYTSLKDIGTSIPPTNAYRKVNVSYTDWDYSSPGLVWSLAAKSAKKLTGGKVTTWTQKITDGTLVAQVDATVSKLPDDAIPGAGGVSSYRVSLDRNGINPHPGLRSLTITQLTATSFQISADNRGRPTAYLVSPSSYVDVSGHVVLGDPSLWVGGIKVTSGDAAIVSVTYGDGKNGLDFGDNAYLQDHDTAVALGNYVLAQVAFSIRDYPTLEIVPDPRIVCGDIKPLTEAKIASISEYIQVWGYTFTADFPPPGQSGGTWTQTLDPRALGPPGAVLGGDIPDRAEVGTSWAYS